MKKQTPTIVPQATLLVLGLLLYCSSFAHTVNYALEKAPVNHVVGYYLKLGFLHIIPYGLDHILFVIGLCLLNSNIKTILWQATAFTIAHSITLAISMKGILVLPSEIVEPVIALSILFIALENILLSELKPWRIVVVFLFGLIHGLGFAAALNEIGLPRNRFVTAIVSFNLGVELGQIAIVVVVYFLLMRSFSTTSWYRKAIVYPCSITIAACGLYWMIERML